MVVQTQQPFAITNKHN